MTSIFISYIRENAESTEHLQKGLGAQGYTVGREPGYPDPHTVSYPQLIENAILGSAAVVVVWSSVAAQSEWVERHLLFAQRLKKPIFPVVLDGTSLPNTLIVNTAIASQPPSTNVVASLIAQPKFPPSQGTDSLIVLSEKAAHEFIRVRKEAIEQAADMLKRDEHREAVLAVLEYLAKNDMTMGVREKAQELLDTEIKKAAPPSPVLHPADSRHVFGVRCKNGHVSYFDKRIVCTAYRQVPRALRVSAGKELDELHLKCYTCDCCVVARVYCEGYK